MIYNYYTTTDDIVEDDEDNVANSVNVIEDIIPTLHAKCIEVDCGGQLVCDRTSHRCLQTIGGPCADDIDCSHGLLCINWVCSNKDVDNINKDDIIKDNITVKSRSIKWADEYNI